MGHNPRYRAALRHGVALACYTAIALIWLRPLTWHLADRITGPGDPLITAWRLVWPMKWLVERPAPFWETNVLYPARDAFARDELLLGQSLIAGPVHLLTGNPLLAHNVTILATLILSGFAMYYLAWYLFHTFTGSLIAGIVYAFAPYHLAQRDHAGLLAIQWLPLVLLFLHRTLRYRRPVDAVCFGLCAFLQAIAAGYYAYWTLLVIALFLGYVWVAERRRFTARGLALAGGALAVALAALVPILLPFARMARDAGFSRTRQEVEYWSARPQSWLAATPDNLLYGPLVRDHAWTWSSELYLFPGIVALGLALFGLVAWRGRLRWFALALAVAGFVLSLGPTLYLGRRDDGIMPLPYDLLYRFIPGGDALRAPLRVAPVAMLGLGLLAAAGWEHLTLVLLLRNALRWATRVAAVALTGLLLVEYATQPLPTQTVPQLDRTPGAVAAWLAREPPHIVAVLPDLRAPVTMALATMNRHRFINGDAEILPPATAALFDALKTFPAVGSVDALSALGVDTIVLLRAGYAEAEWNEMQTRIRASNLKIEEQAMLTNALVLRIDTSKNRYSYLPQLIPRNASVFIADVPPTDPTFLNVALVSHALRAHRVYGNLQTGWVSQPAPPRACPTYGFGVFRSRARIPFEFDARPLPIWTDGVVEIREARTIYRSCDSG